MKKLFAIGIALVALAGLAMAGDYHKGSTLACEECHVMHYSTSHGYNANGGGITTPLGTAGPYEYLLRNDINDLCLSCHDGSSFAPDVLTANGGVVPTSGRLGGALNRDNTSPYFDATGHTLGSMATAPGGTWANANGLNCADCHTVHGRTPISSAVDPKGSYRNLSSYVLYPASTAPGVSYAVGTNDLAKDVFERSNAMGGDHYDINNVDFNEPITNGSNYAGFCKQCHTNFHGTSTDANMNDGTEWLRHPTADADLSSTSFLNRYAGLAYRVKMMSASGNWGTYGTPWVGAPTDLTPSCFSCHKGHGNQNSYGLIFAAGAADLGENGDGTAYKNLCQQCHTRGL
ncbi:MAG: hypothetical protein AB1644_07945 [Candidatus Zixiibacteriota bacterium]